MTMTSASKTLQRDGFMLHSLSDSLHLLNRNPKRKSDMPLRVRRPDFAGDPFGNRK